MQKGFINIFLIVIIVALAGAGIYIASTRQVTSPVPAPIPNPEPVACTEEAKQCPDGSYVSRTGKNCEFAKCPAINPPAVNECKEDSDCPSLTARSEEHTSELQSQSNLVCRLLL